MQNRLETAKETQVMSQKQLEEIKASIEVEKNARNDTVSPPYLFIFTLAVALSV